MTSVARRTLRVTAAAAGVAAIGAGLAGTAFALPGLPALPGVPDLPIGALPTDAVAGLVGQLPSPTDALSVPGLTSFEMPTLDTNTAALPGLPELPATPFDLPGLPSLPDPADLVGSLPALPDTGAVAGALAPFVNTDLTPGDLMNQSIDTAGISDLPSLPGVTGGLPIGDLPALPSLDTATATAMSALGVAGELASPAHQISGHAIGL